MKSARRLRRFISSQRLVSTGQIVSLSPSETHHLRATLRLRIGDHCLLSDGSGKEAQAKIHEFLKSGSTRVIVEKIQPIAVSKNLLILRVVQALAKKGKIDDLIEKAQELGVDEFWPVQTERSMFHISSEKESKILARWQKKTLESAKQSGSLKWLQVASPKSFKEAVSAISSEEEIVIFHPEPKEIPFRKWIEELEQRNKNSGGVLNLFFGPEGGFSEREIEWAKNCREKTGNACKIVTLGDNILKVDTAFLGVVSTLKFLGL